VIVVPFLGVFVDLIARGLGDHLPDQRVRVTEASRALADAFANWPRIM
jgi:hypothetical protein